MGACAFREKNVYFEKTSEREARVEMLRKYLERDKTPHLKATLSDDSRLSSDPSDSPSEEIVVEEVEDTPGAPLKPQMRDSAVQDDRLYEIEPRSRPTSVAAAMPAVKPMTITQEPALNIMPMQLPRQSEAAGVMSPQMRDSAVQDDRLYEIEPRSRPTSVAAAMPAVKPMTITREPALNIMPMQLPRQSEAAGVMSPQQATRSQTIAHVFDTEIVKPLPRQSPPREAYDAEISEDHLFRSGEWAEIDREEESPPEQEEMRPTPAEDLEISDESPFNGGGFMFVGERKETSVSEEVPEEEKVCELPAELEDSQGGDTAPREVSPTPLGSERGEEEKQGGAMPVEREIAENSSSVDFAPVESPNSPQVSGGESPETFPEVVENPPVVIIAPVEISPTPQPLDEGEASDPVEMSIHEAEIPAGVMAAPLEEVQLVPNEENVSESSVSTPRYTDLPTRARESRFSDFQLTGRQSQDAACVFIRPHYLRNPAPQLPPEYFNLNQQGRLTIEDEERIRASFNSQGM